jgi:hypothetical protein
MLVPFGAEVGGHAGGRLEIVRSEALARRNRVNLSGDTRAREAGNFISGKRR